LDVVPRRSLDRATGHRSSPRYTALSCYIYWNQRPDPSCLR